LGAAPSAARAHPRPERSPAEVRRREGAWAEHRESTEAKAEVRQAIREGHDAAPVLAKLKDRAHRLAAEHEEVHAHVVEAHQRAIDALDNRAAAQAALDEHEAEYDGPDGNARYDALSKGERSAYDAKGKRLERERDAAATRFDRAKRAIGSDMGPSKLEQRAEGLRGERLKAEADYDVGRAAAGAVSLQQAREETATHEEASRRSSEHAGAVRAEHEQFEYEAGQMSDDEAREHEAQMGLPEGDREHYAHYGSDDDATAARHAILQNLDSIVERHANDAAARHRQSIARAADLAEVEQGGLPALRAQSQRLDAEARALRHGTDEALAEAQEHHRAAYDSDVAKREKELFLTIDSLKRQNSILDAVTQGRVSPNESRSVWGYSPKEVARRPPMPISEMRRTSPEELTTLQAEYDRLAAQTRSSREAMLRAEDRAELVKFRAKDAGARAREARARLAHARAEQTRREE
jgi:hypothetical protein